MTTDDPTRFEQLRVRAKSLGWELIDRDDHQPWGYLLRPFDEELANVCTNSAARLDPEDPDNPLTGLDSVSFMLDQIAFAQEHKHS